MKLQGKKASAWERALDDLAREFREGMVKGVERSVAAIERLREYTPPAEEEGAYAGEVRAIIRELLKVRPICNAIVGALEEAERHVRVAAERQR